MLRGSVKSRILVEGAEVSEKRRAKGSQPQQCALESPFLEVFCHVPWKGMGREGKGERKKKLSKHFLAILVIFSLLLSDQGKEPGERSYFWVYNCEIAVWAELGVIHLEGYSNLN